MRNRVRAKALPRVPVHWLSEWGRAQRHRDRERDNSLIPSLPFTLPTPASHPLINMSGRTLHPPPFKSEASARAHAKLGHMRKLVGSEHIAPTQQRAKEIQQVREEAEAAETKNGTSLKVSSVRIFDLDEELSRRSSQQYVSMSVRLCGRSKGMRGQREEEERASRRF